MTPNSARLGATIAGAQAWPAFVRCRNQGADPLSVDYSADGGEAYYALMSVALPSQSMAAPYEALRGVFGRVAEKAKGRVSVQTFSDVFLDNLRRPVMPVLLQAARPGLTEILLKAALLRFRQEANIPSDEEMYPHTPVLFGLSWPAEAAWCVHSLRKMAAQQDAELPEQEMHYLVYFLHRLAAERVLFTHLANQLLAVAVELRRCNLTEWSAWRLATGRQLPEFASMVSADQVSGLVGRDPADQEQHLGILFREIQSHRLDSLSQRITWAKAKAEKRLHGKFLSEAVAFSRAIGTESLAGGGSDDSAVEGFDRPLEDLTTEEE